jgi:hypothetical protein
MGEGDEKGGREKQHMNEQSTEHKYDPKKKREVKRRRTERLKK